MLDGLFARIESQREALVELTRELVRIPTVNPPGDAYKACARHLGNRLQRSGFEIAYVRAAGAVGGPRPGCGHSPVPRSRAAPTTAPLVASWSRHSRTSTIARWSGRSGRYVLAATVRIGP